MTPTYVIFTRRMANKRWWHNMTHPKFNHVFTMQAAHDGTALVVDCLLHGAFAVSYPSSLGEMVSSAVHHPKVSAIVSVKPNHSGDVNKMVIGPHNCVTLTKAILGIKKPFVLTPMQLFTHLMKEGSGYALKTPIY